MIWKIKSGSNLKLVNLVKVIRVSLSKVYVKSIIDNHEYEYNKNFFLRYREPATQADIERYTFKV